MIVLNIPEATPSLNQTLRHGHWSKHHRHRKHWAMLVLVAKSDAGVYGDPPRFQKARVTIERHSCRRLDHDNAIGGAKAVIDGLKDCGLIVDDSPEHIELRLEQHLSRETQRTVIRIEPA